MTDACPLDHSELYREPYIDGAHFTYRSDSRVASGASGGTGLLRIQSPMSQLQARLPKSPGFINELKRFLDLHFLLPLSVVEEKEERKTSGAATASNLPFNIMGE